MGNKILLALLAVVFGASDLIGQQLGAGRPEYTPLVVPADSVGSCISEPLRDTALAKRATTLAFEVPLSMGGDRSIRLVEFQSGEVRYLELASSYDLDQRVTLTGIVGRVDSAGGVSGFRQDATKTAKSAPVLGMKPLTVYEKQRIPLLINWMRMRCGAGR